MKKSELKSIIKECVKEILFEEGVLSNLVAEVAFGITKAQGQILETQQPQVSTQMTQELKQEQQEQKRKQLLETKRKMLNAVGGDRMSGVFEGTTPLPNTGTTNSQSPLAGKDPSDAGVDISGLFGLAGQKWKQLK